MTHSILGPHYELRNPYFDKSQNRFVDAVAWVDDDMIEKSTNALLQKVGLLGIRRRQTY